jgi:hypothetical protein
VPAPEQIFVSDCPPGLEYLLQIDRFIVNQRGNSTFQSVIAILATYHDLEMIFVTRVRYEWRILSSELRGSKICTLSIEHVI